MNIVLVRAVDPGLIRDDRITPHALEQGFPFLVDADTEEIVEPVFRYLMTKFKRGNRYSLKTAEAYLDDLRDWFYFLDDVGWPWDEVDGDHIKSYLSQLEQIVSPHTRKRYSTSTLRRRAVTVIDFYVWATRANHLKVEIDFEWKSASKVDSDRDALAHTKARASKRVSGLIPNSRRGTQPAISVIEPHEYQVILEALGPSPTARKPGERKSCRDRLIAEWGIQTGMRVDEILSLELWQILALGRDGRDDLSLVNLHISKTKGLNPRYVETPIWLLDETLAYVDGEREESVRRTQPGRSPNRLFLHHPWARNVQTDGVRYRSVHEIFTSACKAAGLTIQKTVRNPATGKTENVIQAKYHHHVLRHTFAVYHYLYANEMGLSHPWKKVQSLLGHKHESTTIDTYLRAVSALDKAGLHGKIAERFQQAFRELAT